LERRLNASKAVRVAAIAAATVTKPA